MHVHALSTDVSSTGFASQRYSRTAQQFQAGPPLVEHAFEVLPEDPFGEDAAEEAREKEGAAAEHNLPDDPFGEYAHRSSLVLHRHAHGQAWI